MIMDNQVMLGETKPEQLNFGQDFGEEMEPQYPMQQDPPMLTLEQIESQMQFLAQFEKEQNLNSRQKKDNLYKAVQEMEPKKLQQIQKQIEKRLKKEVKGRKTRNFHK